MVQKTWDAVAGDPHRRQGPVVSNIAHMLPRFANPTCDLDVQEATGRRRAPKHGAVKRGSGLRHAAQLDRVGRLRCSCLAAAERALGPFAAHQKLPCLFACLRAVNFHCHSVRIWLERTLLSALQSGKRRSAFSRRCDAYDALKVQISEVPTGRGMLCLARHCGTAPCTFIRPRGTGSSPTRRDGPSTIAKAESRDREKESRDGRRGGRREERGPQVSRCEISISVIPRRGPWTRPSHGDSRACCAGTASTNFHGDLGFEPWSTTHRELRAQRAELEWGPLSEAGRNPGCSLTGTDLRTSQPFGEALVLREVRGSRTERVQGFLGATSQRKKKGKQKLPRCWLPGSRLSQDAPLACDSQRSGSVLKVSRNWSDSRSMIGFLNGWWSRRRQGQGGYGVAVLRTALSGSVCSARGEGAKGRGGCLCA